MFYVANNADDRDPVDLGIARPTDSFPKWFLVLKILAHERIVRDADEWRFVVKVCWSKVTTAPQRNLHDFEVVAEDAARFQTRFVARRDRRPAFDQKIVIERGAAARKFGDPGGEQPSPDEQRERHCKLNYDKRAAQSLPRTAGGSAASAFLERVARATARRRPRRQCA